MPIVALPMEKLLLLYQAETQFIPILGTQERQLILLLLLLLEITP